ncbi:ATP-binding protein [Actinoplanes cyaneus]|uniref:ATP-binding protein n=1 Tax=Actinoplanes cyaneus TaxID=52696 RepID=UPI001EF30F72|nr:sensor histidine kinase [Actinoplanes cyaneus]MCW2139716.1 Signal transduction histidine kinase [Actinoplanes cyaneus]
MARIPFPAEIGLSLAAGAGAFAFSALVCSAARGHLPDVPLGLALLAAVLLIARATGILYALPAGVAAILAYDWFFLPPLRDMNDAAFTILALFLVMAVIVSAVTTAAGRRAVEAERARGDLADELIKSRARIVAAADEARRRIERDLHDGAQQRLVALALRLRTSAIDQQAAAGDLLEVIDELRELSRGIHPAVLSDSGLRPALRALGRRSPLPVEVDVRLDARPPEQVEVCAYYVVSEMLTNAVKHADATTVAVTVEPDGDAVSLTVRDDGIGGADPARGTGLVGLKDRVEALGGTLEVRSPAGEGTTVTCRLPGSTG